METKANPNPSGCLAKALPHEPMFVLLARDAVAPEVIRFWADLRSKAMIEGEMDRHTDQISEAIDTADAFESWRIEHDGEWRGAIAKRLAKVERIARRIAAACSPDENVDLIWQAHTAEAEAALVEFEAMESENG